MSTYNPEQEFQAIVAPRVEIQDVLKWVYLWMGLGLLLTALVSVFTVNTPAMLRLRNWLSGSVLIGVGAFVAFSRRAAP